MGSTDYFSAIHPISPGFKFEIPQVCDRPQSKCDHAVKKVEHVKWDRSKCEEQTPFVNEKGILAPVQQDDYHEHRNDE
jgi:hypothetical protein